MTGKARAEPRTAPIAGDAWDQSEARLKAIWESSLDAIVTMDEAGRISGWNPAAERIFGYQAGEVVGKRVAETIMPMQYREAHEQGLANFLRTGRGAVIGRVVEGLSGLRRDGSEFPIELAITLAWHSGAEATFVAFIRDVSEERRADDLRRTRAGVTQALSESNSFSGAAPRLLAALGEGLGWDAAGLWIFDEERQELHWERAWSKPGAEISAFINACEGTTFRAGVGLPGQVLAAGEPAMLSDLAQADDPRRERALAAGLHSASAYPVDDHVPMSGVFEFYSRRQRATDPDLEETMADIAGQIGQFREGERAERERILVNEQLTAREERYRAITEASSDLISVTSLPGTFEFLSPASTSILGYEPDELAGRAVEKLIHPGDVQRMREVARRVADGTHETAIYRLRRRDGVHIWVETSSRLLRDPVSGAPLQVVSVTRDITERQRAERIHAAQLAISAALTAANTWEEAAPTVLRVLCQSLGFAVAELWLIDNNDGLARLQRRWDDR